MGISGKRVAVLATNGFEQSELEVPVEKLRAAGATVEVVSPESGGGMHTRKRSQFGEVSQLVTVVAPWPRRLSMITR